LLEVSREEHEIGIMVRGLLQWPDPFHGLVVTSGLEELNDLAWLVNELPMSEVTRQESMIV
jgi:hypothetical protein